MKVGKMKALSFCDVLVIPRFSSIISRKDVNTSINFLGEHLETPIMSSNMDTVTEHQMATAITKAGGIGTAKIFTCKHSINKSGTASNKFIHPKLNGKRHLPKG